MLYANMDKLHYLSSASFHKTWLLIHRNWPRCQGVTKTAFEADIDLHRVRQLPPVCANRSVWKAWGRTRRPGRQVGYRARPICEGKIKWWLELAQFLSAGKENRHLVLVTPKWAETAAKTMSYLSLRVNIRGPFPIIFASGLCAFEVPDLSK